MALEVLLQDRKIHVWEGAALLEPLLSPHESLRVGYFRTDLGDQPVGRLVATVPHFHARGRTVEAYAPPLTASDGSR